MTRVIYHHITHGSFDADTFQDFLISLLKVMKPYLAKHSGLSWIIVQFIMLKVLLSCVLNGETFFIPLIKFLTWLLVASSSYICCIIHPISTPLKSVI